MKAGARGCTPPRRERPASIAGLFCVTSQGNALAAGNTCRS
ncbi:hypothetical protein RHECNPAF_930042 [Rhizobium etli CNPAF512]|nr:hypothetical protein RHECNPAF_930042 [Rhizobium etli CNPAF512]